MNILESTAIILILGLINLIFIRFISNFFTTERYQKVFWFEEKWGKMIFLRLLLSSALVFLALVINSLFKVADPNKYYGFLTVMYTFLTASVLFVLYSIFVAPFISKAQDNVNKSDNNQGFTLRTASNKSIQIANPSRGIFICGGAGSGKTASIINPILEQAGHKNYTGLIYDFKFPTLANQVKDSWKASPVQQYFINFTDLQKSHRVNPIAPEYIKSQNHAREAAKTLITNIDFKAAEKRDYWLQCSEALLSAGIWYFKKKHPQYCNLPTVISFLLNPDTNKTLIALSSDIEVSNMASPVLSSLDNEKALSSIFSTLQNYLSILASPEIFWILSKAEVNLNLNNPENPSILVLGNDPSLSGTFSPLISLIASTALKMMNTQGKEQSLVLLDEAPTLFIPNFAQIPATARENKVATIYSVQDIAQMEALMSPTEAEMIISNLGTAFYGRVTNVKTAERVSKMFGKYDKQITSTSKGTSQKNTDWFDSTDTKSTSTSVQERDRLKATEVIAFTTGQFAGINAEGNVREFNEVFQYKNTSTEKVEDFNYISENQIQSNYIEILELGRNI